MEYTDRYKAFCKRMSIYRKLMDYDQAKMAVRVGMTTPEYSNREAGRSMVSGIDLRKFSDSGADIDKMLVDVDEKPCRYEISSEIETFGEESKKEYVRGVVSEHILYMCEKKIADFSDETVKYIRLLKSIDKDSTKDSMLKCIRDVNGITDQQVISDNLGISRFKYSKIENNKELPDAMVLIRLYDLYGSIFLIKMLDMSNICFYNKHMFELYSDLTTMEKLEILADAAKYDVACTSSGVDRKGKKGFLGNSVACGVCHSFGADGRCISLLKVLMTNHCVYDCKYCMNRCSNDVPRATFTPDELCRLVIEFYKRNYIEGLFLSSGVLKNPSYTMERICETLMLLRTKYRFNGYIHVKAIPGAPDELLSRAGYLADRVSINLELPTAQSLSKLAPNKSFKTILEPMEKITGTIAANRLALGKDARMERSSINRYLTGSIFNQNGTDNGQAALSGTQRTALESGDKLSLPAVSKDMCVKRPFAPAGQSTQMIIGATPETDLTLIRTTQHLYKNYDLKRVFYSAYIPLNEDSALPQLDADVPLLREHRLYQADWLLRFYGFQADELLSESRPNFNEQLDPKCDWAIRHLGQFPVEVQNASYDMLLRIPGIGPKSARRIVETRRYAKLDFDILKKIGVVLKRAHYFITCNGRMMYRIPIEESYITECLTDDNHKENWEITHQNEKYQQLSLFE